MYVTFENFLKMFWFFVVGLVVLVLVLCCGSCVVLGLVLIAVFVFVAGCQFHQNFRIKRFASQFF